LGGSGVDEKDRPLAGFSVEQGEVGENQIFMLVYEDFVEGAVQAFDAGIQFWPFGVGISALDAPIPQ
jgi:hypothetical protein